MTLEKIDRSSRVAFEARVEELVRMVGLKDALADAGERFATPVCEFCDQLVNTFRWIHWLYFPLIAVRFAVMHSVFSAH